MSRDLSRVFVLNSIREEFGTAANNYADGEANFDHFVQTQLPKVLTLSKRDYKGKLKAVALDAFQMVFGA